VRLGYRHPLSKLAHGVLCTDAGCDPYRPEFIFVQPGSIAFRLRPPSITADGVNLILSVQSVGVGNRENRIFVNDHDLGLVDDTRMSTLGRLVVPIPPEARSSDSAWTVKVGPGDHQDKIGYDVSWAALTSGSSTAAAGDECPARFCLNDSRGEFCEDGKTPPRRG
jgi:hypothetical protein